MDTEGHPIPQDITGFQFRLIGDMTIKQFAYLGGGVILAWIFFSSTLSLVIKIPLVTTFALSGVVLAFMPIHGRPADVMIMLFFKALFKPNQFTYTQTAAANTPAQESTITSSQTQDTNHEQPAQQTPEVSAVTPHADSPPPVPGVSSPQPPLSPVTPLPAGSEGTPPEPVILPPVTPVKKTPALPPDAINLVAGVVEDPRGNVLQDIIVEVTDPDGSPVRAFKTNFLGQFIAATPLSNGTYTVTFEDPDKRHKFPTLTLIAKGEPLEPLEVTSMDQREQLRQALFTPTNILPIQEPG